MYNLIRCTFKRCRLHDYKFILKLTMTHWRQVKNLNINSIRMMSNDLDSTDKNNKVNPMDFFYWLQKSAPGFPIDASKVKIIHEPAVFYSTLLDKCKKAEKRITLASLYLGTGKLEGDLVEAIEKSVIASNGQLKVNILLDYMRGSRGQNNSRKMLEPLLNKQWADNIKVHLYHTPKLRGLLKKFIPNRFNELIGLQHMKVYIFDDSLIISGANLSNDYFMNRQDRYFLIEDCKELCDFYNELIYQVSNFSFKLMPDNSTSFDTESSPHPFESPAKEFVSAAKNRIRKFYFNQLDKRQTEAGNNQVTADTWIFPLIQMGQLGIYHDNEITLRLLKTAPAGASLQFATGYFNLTTEYSNALVRDCQASVQLLTAHPTANGFYGAKGVAGGIPAAYTLIEKSFYKYCERMKMNERIKLREYIRSGWTYHAKGLWYTLPNQKKPSFTLIGSSNFGYRSVNRDLETQIAVVTKNDKLKNDLHEEYNRLYKNSHQVNRSSLSQPDRIAPTWVYAAVFLFRYFF
ncbi:CDP-diacylglycerol--glycerol-3-phosphate 3-phosphatidyltransferase, mitochondrial isoform X1 [Microplitis mediator]|uniref:CDP-diacylglycerol--glycerol-3-phosphate 3-phosphatidyltransferase, mitochondrial isoform X1 n=1 Tax=Microplitis mediator TaxID=375433 RepID=UPI00255496F8|nr:CDP-diacylglycerol--glycerol-3-phosphate 3-phosphatidyltransferase, mitochondrial isoform X1 [Microplitis mediator]